VVANQAFFPAARLRRSPMAQVRDTHHIFAERVAAAPPGTHRAAL